MISPGAAWIVETGYIRQTQRRSSLDISPFDRAQYVAAMRHQRDLIPLEAAGGQLAFVPIGAPTTFGGLTALLPHFGFPLSPTSTITGLMSVSCR